MGVAVMLHAMEALQGRDLPLEAHFAATAQEEVGCRGSGVLAYGLAPDLAVVLDVTHGETPDAPKLRAFDMDKVSIGWCPVTHNGWTGALRRVAEEAGMKKPTSGQVEYLELPSSDSAVVYRGDAGTALENIVDSIAAAVSSVVEYFR